MKTIMTLKSNCIPVLNPEEILRNLSLKKNPFWPQYYAFYSSWFGGILKNPNSLLLLPMDDHMVHRGDGVFEAIKVIERKIYLFEAHVQRLKDSAQKIGLVHSYSTKKLQDILIQTLKVADQSHALIRIFLSRGPGAFSVNPYDSIGSELYIVISQLNPLANEKYQQGVRVGRSSIVAKEGFMAQIKSCNYLLNVLMKKEAVDRHLDFTVSFDFKGYLAESATENIVILDKNGILTQPQFENILKGTTMTRTFELAAKAGIKTANRNISEADIFAAKEVLMLGTTLDVLPVTHYENQPIADGKVGEVCKLLHNLILKDMQNGILF